MSVKSLKLPVLLAFLLPACGTGAAPGQQTENVTTAQTDSVNPLTGELLGSPFVPKSAVFAIANNYENRLELQVVLSSAPDYCNLLMHQQDQNDSIKVRLRMMRVDNANQAVTADANSYVQVNDAHWSSVVGDIPPPSANEPLAPGRYLSAGYVSLSNSCNSVSLQPAFVGSSVTMGAVQGEKVSGSVQLVYDDGTVFVANTAFSGDFTATLCPSLVDSIATSPFSGFTPPTCPQ